MDSVGLTKLGSPMPPGGASATGDAQLMKVARKLEASFLSEMLKSAGVGKSPESFGGGAGEDQFSSFLLDAQAQEMVKAGGIGLAQSLFEALKEQDHGTR
ncbi:rod-binding protein [Aliiroseovarius sediminis]|uniref:rod-binding protein n=2 Tax=Aliiroseovarius TaxID=1658781 RepID=UPI003B847013